MKIVLNSCFGGFGLSQTALDELGIDFHGDIERTDPRLVEVVEKLGDRVNVSYSKLVIVDIPDHLKFWEKEDYDGMESIIASETKIYHF